MADPEPAGVSEPSRPGRTRAVALRGRYGALQLEEAIIATAVAHGRKPVKPGLVFFYSSVSGASRRVDAFLAQVLQRRQNHGTFTLYHVDESKRPDLVERFRIDKLPTLVVVEDKAVRGRLVGPRGCRDIEDFLAPWLK